MIIVVIFWLSVPIVSWLYYLNRFTNNSKQITQELINDSSEKFFGLKVWCKNYDILKKKYKFNADPFQTNYSFYSCDLILNADYFVVIGKTRFFGKEIDLHPIIFFFGENKLPEDIQNRVVRCENIHENGGDLEVLFSDKGYTNKMTLVIKGIDKVLKSKIILCFNIK